MNGPRLKAGVTEEEVAMPVRYSAFFKIAASSPGNRRFSSARRSDTRQRMPSGRVLVTPASRRILR